MVGVAPNTVSQAFSHAPGGTSIVTWRYVAANIPGRPSNKVEYLWVDSIIALLTFLDFRAFLANVRMCISLMQRCNQTVNVIHVAEYALRF